LREILKWQIVGAKENKKILKRQLVGDFGRERDFTF